MMPPVSAHLWYGTNGRTVERFECELTVPVSKDPVNSYFCACGFSRGYFGMQVNSETERRILFSVWDDGKGTPVDTLSAHPEALVEPFGGEGEGMHAILFHQWETGIPQRFGVTARVEAEKKATIYTGLFYMNEEWTEIASFRAPNDGHYLKGLYSFCENFGQNTTEERRCLFSNQKMKPLNCDQWVTVKEAGCTTTKCPEGDFFNFAVENECFSVSINGTQGKTCQPTNPKKLLIAI